MAVFSAFLFIMIQSGGRGIQTLFNRFLGGRNNDEKQKADESRQPARVRPQVSSGDVLRQRAQQLDFHPQAAYQETGGFSAQNVPQQPSLTSRDPLSPPQQNPNFGQQQNQFGQTSPSMPRLSSARPFQPGTQSYSPSNQGYNAPSGQFGQQGQYPQQQGQYPQQGQQPRYPQQGEFGRQHQGEYPQQEQYAQQQQAQNPQQNPLGPYRPQLQNRPNFDPTQNTGPGLRRKRDSRRGDDRDIYYDDNDPGLLGGLVDDVGDLLG
jgi:hypothetical protein